MQRLLVTGLHSNAVLGAQVIAEVIWVLVTGSQSVQGIKASAFVQTVSVLIISFVTLTSLHSSISIGLQSSFPVHTFKFNEFLKTFFAQTTQKI